MLGIIIPIYKARDTLPKALDSLVAQTKTMFLVTLVQDCDGEDYSDIIEEYKRRGLHINLVQMEKNVGPGLARQRGIDVNERCEYLMFLDSDDMLLPEAVEVLTREISVNKADIAASSIIAEMPHKPSMPLPVETTPVQWCFTAGTPILTEKGYKPIEELQIGELVYTHDGTLHPIENIMSHEATNVVTTKISGALSLSVTKNHKFFIYEEGQLFKKPIEEIENRDKVSLFNLPERKVHINSALAKVIGRYVGDGWKTSRKRKLKSGTKEYWEYYLCSAEEEQEEVVKMLTEAKVSFSFHKSSTHSIEYFLHKKNKELIKYIDDCGRYAHSKHFPTEFLTWDDESLSALLDGYFSADGCVTNSHKSGPMNILTTVSQRLALETGLILRTLGYNPTYYKKELEGKKEKIVNYVCNRHDEYSIYWRDSNDLSKYVHNEDYGCYTYGLKLSEDRTEMVYNLTVKDNHSYIAGDFIVSNCHGKCYRRKYLIDKNIRFDPQLRLNEDSYFNLVAFNGTEKHIRIPKETYLWRYNKNSLTRTEEDDGDFFARSWDQYLLSQVRGIKKLYEVNKIPDQLLGATLINIYTHYMKAFHFKQDTSKVDWIFNELAHIDEMWTQLDNKPVWEYINANLKCSDIENDTMYFFRMRFIDWLEYVKKVGRGEHEDICD